MEAMWRHIRRAIIAMSLAMGVAGCASSQHSTADTRVIEQNGDAIVEVRLDEYRIHMPTTVPAGHVIFQVANTGHHEHNIRIRGEGVDARLERNLEPGEHADLALDLPPGEYKVDCPVGPHAMLGMKLVLRVTN